MALDLIKQYLIGIGFSVDSNSLGNVEGSMKQAEDKIKKFNDNSNKGFSETGESVKDLFSLFKSNSLGSLFPELQKPFKGLIKDVELLRKVYDDLSNKKVIDKSDGSKEQKQAKETYKNGKPVLKENKELAIVPKVKDEVNPYKNILKDILNLKKGTKSLLLEGGAAIKTFASTSVGKFIIIAAAVEGVIVATKKLVNFLGDLAQKDIEYEKLSRQLWTTKENAKDIDSALKTLGASMEDLWLSPTLLKQFNQLRKDSSQLRLPPEFKDNIKVIQGLGLEIKRFKQLGALAFQWIGNYILKYIAGPLNNIRKGFSKFNNGTLKTIPFIAKMIGSAIGIILRLLLIIGEVLSPIFLVISKIFNLIISMADKVPGPLKKILKIIGVIGALILAGPLGAILLVIAAIDDLFTFLSGGKSVIGTVFDFFKVKGDNAIDSISNKFGDLKDRFKDGMATIKDDWNSYWDKASTTLDKLKNKAKEVWGDIKEWSKGFFEKTKDFVANIGSKIEVYNKSTDDTSTPASYLTNNNTSNNTSMANSNNKINNSNTINVYGTESKSTANEVNRSLTGISIRNLQGVY